MTISILGLILLSAAILLCLFGIASAYFDDNLLHCIGLALMLMWMVSEIRFVIMSGTVTAREIWLYAGIVCFGSGTAIRTWLYAKKTTVPRMRQDPIEAALDHIIDRCRLSWSENEIIALVENVKIMRRQEKSGLVSLPVAIPKSMVVGDRERWS